MSFLPGCVFKGLSQLGQIEEAIVETSGSISIFYFPDEEVKFGLSIMPDSLEGSTHKIDKLGIYSCIFCGYTEEIKPTQKHTCPKCHKSAWVKSK
jgi:uncharacterized membrane protein YcaP (DUF421 family)